MTPVLLDVEEFAWTEYVKLPLPLPLVEFRVIQLTFLLAVQLPEAVTETELPEEAAEERPLVTGETDTESVPAWKTV